MYFLCLDDSYTVLINKNNFSENGQVQFQDRKQVKSSENPKKNVRPSGNLKKYLFRLLKKIRFSQIQQNLV